MRESQLALQIDINPEKMVGKAWKSQEKESKIIKQPAHNRATIIIIGAIGLITALKNERRRRNRRLIFIFSYSYLDWLVYLTPKL